MTALSESIQGRRRLAQATGVSAVALMIGGTRWGSYIGLGGIYLTDILIFLSVVQLFVWRSGFRQVVSPASSNRSLLPFALSCFLTYVIFRVVGTTGDFSYDWLRDTTVLGYSLLAVVSAYSVSQLNEAGRVRTMNVLWIGLYFHLAWTSITVLADLPNDAFPALPGSPVPIFGLRPDIDCAILGITSALLIRRGLKGDRPWRHWSLAVLGLSVVLSLATRAGVLAALASCAVAFWLSLAGVGGTARVRDRFVASSFVVVLFTVFWLPTTNVGSRLLATVNPSSAQTQAEVSAVGTARARDEAWGSVIDWTNERPLRALFGVGPGPDFVALSGAASLLEGSDYENVRSPHNIFVSLYARVGGLGLVLFLASMLQLFWIVSRTRSTVADDELVSFAAFAVVGILVVAALGVNLESPFGAVPFWWACGIIASIDYRRRGRLRQI